MEKLSKEQVQKTVLYKTFFPGFNKDPFIIALKELSVGEGIILKREEWKRVSTPSSWIGATFRKQRTNKKFSCYLLANKESWIITRVL